MADDFAVRRLGEHRAFVEGLRQRFEAERGEEALACLDHLHRVIIFRDQQFGRVIADVAGAFRCNDIIDIAPFLRPHIAEQIGADRTSSGLDLGAIFFVELVAGVAMQFVIERLDLRP